MKQKVIGKETKKGNLIVVNENQQDDLCKYEALDESDQSDKTSLNKEFISDEPQRIWTAQGAILIDSKGKVISEYDQQAK